jgi:multidrug resistance protein, MATE family
MRYAIHRSILQDIVRLGWPVLVAQIAMMLYAVLDTIMAGRYGQRDLAAVGIGASIYITVFIALMGVLIAIGPIVSHLFGAKRYAEIGEEVRQTFWLGVLLAAIPILVLNNPEPFFKITQAEPAVEELAREYLAIIAWSVPASLLFRVFHGFATAISRPRIVMVLNLLGLAIKIPLNWIFMYGMLGAPEMGGVGCALATTIASWITCIAAWAICYASADYRPYGIFARWSWPSWLRIRHVLAIGVPIGFTFLVDVTAFTFMTLFIARLGTQASAAHQIAANFAALTFMLPLALGSAVGVLVGQALGAGDLRRARVAGLLGLVVAALMAGVLSLLMFVARNGIAQLYSIDIGVSTLAAQLLVFVALYHLVDAVQTVAINVLRGYKRTLVPMLAYTVALWGVGLGGGYWLGLTTLGREDWTQLGLSEPLGAAGFWIAAIASLGLASVAVVFYFLAVSRAGRRPRAVTAG